MKQTQHFCLANYYNIKAFRKQKNIYNLPNSNSALAYNCPLISFVLFLLIIRFGDFLYTIFDMIWSNKLIGNYFFFKFFLRYYSKQMFCL